MKKQEVVGLETLKQFVETNAKSRLYPDTEWSARGLFRYRKALGLEDAFVKVGSRILVNRSVFYARLAKEKKVPKGR